MDVFGKDGGKCSWGETAKSPWSWKWHKGIVVTQNPSTHRAQARRHHRSEQIHQDASWQLFRAQSAKNRCPCGLERLDPALRYAASELENRSSHEAESNL